MINIKKEKRVARLTILSFTLYLIGLLIFEGVIYIFIGIGLLSFLGFTYNSYGSVFLFFAITYLLLLPVDYFSSILISSFKSKSKLSNTQQRLLDFIFYCAFSSLIIGCVDFFIDSIHISPENQVLFILLYYLFKIYCENLILKK